MLQGKTINADDCRGASATAPGAVARGRGAGGGATTLSQSFTTRQRGGRRVQINSFSNLRKQVEEKKLQAQSKLAV